MLSLDAPSNSPQFHVFGGHVTFCRKPIIPKKHQTAPRPGFCQASHSHLVREGKGTSYFYTKSPVFSAFAAPKWNTGDFIVRHYTVATGTRREHNNKIEETARVSNATATQGTLCNNDWVGHHRLQWYGTNSILVSKYSDYRSPLTTGREGGSREILKRAPQKEYLR